MYSNWFKDGILALLITITNIYVLQSMTSLWKLGITTAACLIFAVTECLLLRKGGKILLSANTAMAVIMAAVVISGRDAVINGVKIIINQLEYKSEVEYGYVYEHYSVDIPASDYNMAVTAVYIISIVIICMIAFVALRCKLRCVLLGIIAFWTGAQVYLGVSAEWVVNFCMFAVIGLSLMYLNLKKQNYHDKRANNKLLLQILAITAIICIMSAGAMKVLFPDSSSGVDIRLQYRAQMMRDAFDSTVEKYDGSAASSGSGGAANEKSNTRLPDESSGGASKDISYKKSDKEKTDWLYIFKNIYIMLAAGLIFLVVPAMVINRKKKLKHLRKELHSNDRNAAVEASLGCVMKWFKVMGVKPDGRNLGQYDICALEFGGKACHADFKKMLEIWEEAQYSGQTVSDSMAGKMIDLLDRVQTVMWSNASRFQKFKLKWIYCLT